MIEEIYRKLNLSEAERSKPYMYTLKSIIKFLDRILFSGNIYKSHSRNINLRNRNTFDLLFNNSYIVNYEIFPNEIAELCDKHGTDNGSILQFGPDPDWPSHRYSDVYFQLFEPLREKALSIVEMGIGSGNVKIDGHFKKNGIPGASLKVWRDFFVNANISGLDIDSSISISEERIKVYTVDQLDPTSISHFWKKTLGDKPEIIIDDGLHTFDAGKCFFENSIDFLSDVGIYIIEDVVLADLISYQDYFVNKNYQVQYYSFIRNKMGVESIHHNSIIVIRKAK